MISICIPIYNFNISALVGPLTEQIKQLEVPAEILLIDDASLPAFKEQNTVIASQHHYIPLDKNIGRAAIRNRFLNIAQYPYLLFLDCDSLVEESHFLQNYVESIKQYPNHVICGGRVYPTTPPSRDKMLRWKYGVAKESKPATIRNKHPHASFMTNNFVIPKLVFQDIRFDESLVDYGHEDTLFGFELRKNEVPIIHSNNPILNGDLETNSEYIHNTEKGITNLVRILIKKQYDKEFIHDVTLLRVFYKLQVFDGLIRFSFRLLKPMLKFFLSKGYISLNTFDFYKLGILATRLKSGK